jgi:glycosyltransferase involved in cell wall biosynthesis
MSRGLAPRLATRYSSSGLALFNSLLATGDYDTVWIEFSQCFWLAEHVEGRSRELVLSVHDLVTQLVTTKRALETIACLGWTFATEGRLLACADRLRVLSNKDAAFLETVFRRDRTQIEIQRPALSPFVFKVRRRIDLIEPNSILFWGAMSRGENSDAALGFIHTTFARLRKAFPAAKLYVVGSDPPPKLLALASEAVVVTGFVHDPTPYFERCAVGIAPLESGAGIKLKVLEMLQARMPVVSTSIGAEGIGADPLLTVAALDHFDSAIQRAWTSC